MAPLIASAEGDRPRELPDADLHRAVCAFVFDLGLYPDPKWGKVTHRILIAWELEQKMADGRPFMLSKEYTLSLFEKSTLFRHLTSWKGQPLSAQELKGLDLETLVGKNCRLNVIHAVSHKGTTYANVDAVLPADKQAEPLKVYAPEPPKWFEVKRQEYATALAKVSMDEADHEEPPPPLPDEVPF